MRDHYKQHMAFPAPVAPALIMPHSQTALAFLKALLDCPSQGCRPIQFMDRQIPRGI